MSFEEQVIEESDVASSEAASDLDPAAVSPSDPEPDVASEPAAEQEVETPEAQAARELAERKAARIAAADATEAKAAQKREDARKQKALDEVKAERAKLEADKIAFAAKQQVHQSREELYARVRAGQAHPDELLRDFGTTYADMTRQMLEANTPEGIAKAAMAEMKSLRAQLDAEKAATSNAQHTAAVNQALTSFSGFLEDQSEEFPNAYDMPEGTIRASVLRISADYRATNGEDPTFEYLAQRLDEEAKELHSEIEKRRALRAQRKKPSDSGTPSPQASTPNGQTATRPGTRTLTSADAATRATTKRPMTDEEIDEWALEELNRSMRPRS